MAQIEPAFILNRSKLVAVFFLINIFLLVIFIREASSRIYSPYVFALGQQYFTEVGFDKLTFG
jgi:hypothetical protein